MNILILTPEAVGSTLLQRLITIYMQFYEFDRSVINLHELTNGLEKYYSPEFNCEIISKKKVESWGHYQTLEQIVELLSSTDHYKVARLAQHHILKRQDPIEQQIPFYRYLDENFFIIACRRQNIFEYAMSASIRFIIKRLNVYNHREKINLFLDMYVTPVEINQTVLLNHLKAYEQYLTWSQDHFNIGSYFEYDNSINDLENYILNLPVFKTKGQLITWQDKFNISLDDWNRFCWIPSDIGRLDIDQIKQIQTLLYTYPEELLTSHQQLTLPGCVAVMETTSEKSRVRLLRKSYVSKLPSTMFTSQMLNFLDYNQAGYNNAQQAMSRMQELDILVSPPPIKKQTLKDKIRMINNYQQCLETYNYWAEIHSNIADVVTDEMIDNQIQREHDFWRHLEF